jgi:hypothetical protein
MTVGRRLLSLLFLLAIAPAFGQQPKFNRFTNELPQLLETDAATVMVRGLTFDFTAKLCARLGEPMAREIAYEVQQWQIRNDAYLKASAAAIGEIAERHVANGGNDAKQAYLQMVLLETTKTANQRVMRQLMGANLDNGKVPPRAACQSMTEWIGNGAAEVQLQPEITRALLPYMQRKGMR